MPGKLRGYMSVSKISDHNTKLTKLCRLKSKGDTVNTFQTLVQYGVFLSDFRIKCLTANNGCSFINNDFKAYYVQMEVSFEYVSTNKPHEIGLSTTVGITLATIISECLLPDSSQIFLGLNWYSRPRFWATGHHTPQSTCSTGRNLAWIFFESSAGGILYQLGHTRRSSKFRQLKDI